ncbi:ATP-grasp domain-containing protein [Pseudoalteromonas sp. YIC-827]|uniref:ATP-grasp domain-containing protein n=1 Tax=Pseudoalteromonas qingdaonensis TaxID=3131913 RepID=A0ABU9MSC8_9GAMM
MKRNNIVILSAGRRVELVKAFQHAANELNLDTLVIGADMCPELSSACYVADESVAVPRVSSEHYVASLLKLCQEKGVGLVVPTIDTELKILSEVREAFLEIGTHIIISDPELIASCRDKRLTGEFFETLGITYPTVYSRENVPVPSFCKPYDGSCSKGAVAIYKKTDLTDDLLNDDKNMFMELVPKSYCEVTVDGYYTNDGLLKCLVPRERLEVRGGEVSKGKTIKSHLYDYLIERLSHIKGARGCITFQVFYNKQTSDIKGLEINPRFGGGFPLTNAVRGEYPKWLMQEYLLDKEITFFDDWDVGAIMLRYDAMVITHEN